MKHLNELDGKEFSKLMESVRNHFPTVYSEIYDYYFIESGSIEESWNNDPDEVWDAEGRLSDLCGMDDGIRIVVEEALKQL